jgi:hypothetical protein
MTVKTHNPELTIRALRPDELNALARLHSLAFKSTSPEKNQLRYKWKINNPTGQRICLVAQNPLGGIVAANTEVPIRLKILDQVYTAAFMINTIVDPSYEARNLPFRLLSQAEIVYPRQGRALVLTFPNERGLKCFRHHIGASRLILRIRRYVKPLNFYALTYEKKRPFLLKVFFFGGSLLLTPLVGLKNWTKKRPLAGLELKHIEKIPDDYEAFWEEANKKYPIAVVRSREFLQWRFFEEPQGANEFYEARLDKKLLGYCVVKLRYKKLDIVDFFCIRKENIISGIFYEIARLACKRGAWWLRLRIHDNYLENLLAEEKFAVDDSGQLALFELNFPDNQAYKNAQYAESWYLGAELQEME